MSSRVWDLAFLLIVSSFVFTFTWRSMVVFFFWVYLALCVLLVLSWNSCYLQLYLFVSENSEVELAMRKTFRLRLFQRMFLHFMMFGL